MNVNGWWWKLGSVALLLYVVIAGLRTPLAPALVHCSISRIGPGEVTFTVTGYNTDFLKGVGAAWLENDSQRVCARTINDKLTDTQVALTFDVPAGMKGEMTDVHVVNDGRDLVMHDALFTVARGAGVTSGACGTGKLFTLDVAFPDRNILNETIRNLFFHVPMWFSMMLLMTIAFVQSLFVLRNNDLGADLMADMAVRVSLVFAALGLITGSLWARVTWGDWWTSDTKLNGAAITVLIYAAYLILRGSVPDAHKRARLAAVYNVFAYVLMLVFIMVLPRLKDSLHPGNGGNPAFSKYDLDNSLRMVFYPACLGWIGLAYWAYRLRVRVARLQA